MKHVLVFVVASIIYVSGYAQCGGLSTDYNSTVDMAFGDDTNDETCEFDGIVTTRSNRSPAVELTNAGKFVLGTGFVKSSAGSPTRTTVGGLVLEGNSVVTISTTDSLIIWGDFTMNGNGDINMTSGTLFVYGNMTITDNATFGSAGKVIIVGNLTVSGGNAAVTVDGGFSVGGTADLGSESLTINDGAVFAANDLTTSGNVTIQSGGTIFVQEDIDDGVTGTITNNNTGGDTDCTNNCCGSLCNSDPTVDELTPEGNTVLPIKLSYFSAFQEKNSVNLVWQTSSEDNFSHFEIYRYEGVEKELVAEVPSTLNSNGDDYFLTDDKPALGLNIYQIRSVDFDGYTEWFSPATIVFQPRDVSFKLYPNPAFSRNLTTDIYEDFDLEVYDLAGRKILSTTVSGKDLGALNVVEKGSYIFRYNINGHLETQRMIIR